MNVIRSRCDSVSVFHVVTRSLRLNNVERTERISTSRTVSTVIVIVPTVSTIKIFAFVAKLDIAIDFYSMDWGFESLRGRMTILKCKHCGETQNLHINYAYHLPDTPVESVLCNECGEITELGGSDESP